MIAEATQAEPIVEVVCKEPEGTFTRQVWPVQLSLEVLRSYYDRLKQFDVVFNDHVPNTPEGFSSIFLSINGKGDPVANGLLWQVDDVGILYLTDMVADVEAQAHFSFWDRRLRGREPLIRQMLKHVFQEYGFHRIYTRVALYATPLLSGVERIGFIKEGRMKECVRKYDQWFDANLYSILERELDETMREEDQDGS